MKILKIILILSLIVILIFLFPHFANANFAASIGTQNNNQYGLQSSTITTTDIINTSHNYYLGLGYTPSTMVHDPTYIILVFNLMAEVQLYATHGSIDSIFYNGTGRGIRTQSSTNL